MKQYAIQGLAKMIRKSQNTKMFQLNIIKMLEGLNFSKDKKEKVRTGSFFPHICLKCVSASQMALLGFSVILLFFSSCATSHDAQMHMTISHCERASTHNVEEERRTKKNKKPTK